jgi:hypothetical protein
VQQLYSFESKGTPLVVEDGRIIFDHCDGNFGVQAESGGRVNALIREAVPLSILRLACIWLILWLGDTSALENSYRFGDWSDSFGRKAMNFLSQKHGTQATSDQSRNLADLTWQTRTAFANQSLLQ